MKKIASNTPKTQENVNSLIYSPDTESTTNKIKLLNEKTGIINDYYKKEVWGNKKNKMYLKMLFHLKMHGFEKFRNTEDFIENFDEEEIKNFIKFAKKEAYDDEFLLYEMFEVGLIENEFFDVMEMIRSFDENRHHNNLMCDFMLYFYDEFIEYNGTKLEANKLTFEQFVNLKRNGRLLKEKKWKQQVSKESFTSK